MNRRGTTNLFRCAIAAALVFSHCSAQKNQPPTQDSSTMQRIYVDSFDCRELISKNETLEVRIQGNLPSPAYTFSRFDLKVTDGVIQITPLASYNPDKMVAQMLVPFEETCTVENLQAGGYEVRVIGRGRASAQNRKIRVQE